MLAISLLVLATLAISISQVVSFRRLKRHVEDRLGSGEAAWCPKAAVILPCKGLDAGFRENIQKLLDQDYSGSAADKVELSEPGERQPSFEVVFSVASEDDPACLELQEILQTTRSVPARLVIAGVNRQRAQKINNQLAALQQVSPDAEVLVFVDSDVIAGSDFLRHLVAPLQDPSIGATTGYRFYVPFKQDCASLLRSLWNRMTAWELANPHLSFAWGGAMAVRRSTFETAKVGQAWQRAADDDLSLTACVKGLGLKIQFVPQCLVASHGDTTMGEFFEWINRQLILTKVYYPELWQRAILRAAVSAVWLLALLAVGIYGLVSSERSLIAASLSALLLIPFEILMLFRAQALWRRVLPAYDGNLSSSFWSTCLGLPLAHCLLPFMTLYSLSTNRISWRGVTYELRSPTETLVV